MRKNLYDKLNRFAAVDSHELIFLAESFVPSAHCILYLYFPLVSLKETTLFFSPDAYRRGRVPVGAKHK